jgi:hypothetical protein
MSLNLSRPNHLSLQNQKKRQHPQHQRLRQQRQRLQLRRQRLKPPLELSLQF